MNVARSAERPVCSLAGGRKTACRESDRSNRRNPKGVADSSDVVKVQVLRHLSTQGCEVLKSVRRSQDSRAFALIGQHLKAGIATGDDTD